MVCAGAARRGTRSRGDGSDVMVTLSIEKGHAFARWRSLARTHQSPQHNYRKPDNDYSSAAYTTCTSRTI